MATQIDKDRPIEELEKEKAWWWAAQKKRSLRLDYLRKGIYKQGPIGGTYAPGLYADLGSMKIEYEAEKEYLKTWPATLRRARVEEHLLDNIPIFITDHAQLVGQYGSAPNVGWSPPAVASNLYTQPNIIPEPLEESLKFLAEVGDWWDKNSYVRDYYNVLDAEDSVKLGSGIAWASSGALPRGYSNKNNEFWQGKRGFEDISAMIEKNQQAMREKMKSGAGPESPDQYRRIRTWEAMKIALEAGIRYARRYARLARIVAENFEADPKRREELLRIAETCERVPAKVPRNLQESLQYDWFTEIIGSYEGSAGGVTPSHPDYYHWPFYEKDVIIDKTLTKDEALDLLGELMIKHAGQGYVSGRSIGGDALQGISATRVWTLGGVKPDGSDACNDLTIAPRSA